MSPAGSERNAQVQSTVTRLGKTLVVRGSAPAASPASGTGSQARDPRRLRTFSSGDCALGGETIRHPRPALDTGSVSMFWRAAVCCLQRPPAAIHRSRLITCSTPHTACSVRVSPAIAPIATRPTVKLIIAVLAAQLVTAASADEDVAASTSDEKVVTPYCHRCLPIRNLAVLATSGGGSDH